MVVPVINNYCIITVKTESDPPIPADPYRPCSLFFSLKLMQSKTGQVHVLRPRRRIQTVKYPAQPCSMLKINSAADTIIEKILQTFMLKRFNQLYYLSLYHATRHVTSYTHQYYLR